MAVFFTDATQRVNPFEISLRLPTGSIPQSKNLRPLIKAMMLLTTTNNSVSTSADGQNFPQAFQGPGQVVRQYLPVHNHLDTGSLSTSTRKYRLKSILGLRSHHLVP